MKATWTRRVGGRSSLSCMRTKFPHLAKLGVSAVCSIPSSRSPAPRAPTAKGRSKTRRLTWSNMAGSLVMVHVVGQQQREQQDEMMRGGPLDIGERGVPSRDRLGNRRDRLVHHKATGR